MSCVGPVYLVIFCYWVGPVPYLELFGVGPVEKNTLYNKYADGRRKNWNNADFQYDLSCPKYHKKSIDQIFPSKGMHPGAKDGRDVPKILK